MKFRSKIPSTISSMQRDGQILINSKQCFFLKDGNAQFDFTKIYFCHGGFEERRHFTRFACLFVLHIGARN